MGQGPGTVGLNQPAELIEANTEVSWGGEGAGSLLALVYYKIGG